MGDLSPSPKQRDRIVFLSPIVWKTASCLLKIDSAYKRKYRLEIYFKLNIYIST